MGDHRAFRALLAVIIGFTVLPFVTTDTRAAEPETWEADFFPVSVTYDREIWGNRSTSSFEGNERFQITARATVFTLQAFTSDTIGIGQCLDTYIASIEQIAALTDLTEFDDGARPQGLRGADEILVAYDFRWPGREAPVKMVQYLTCLEIEPGNLVLIGIETRAGIYAEEIEIIDGILAGVEIDR